MNTRWSKFSDLELQVIRNGFYREKQASTSIEEKAALLSMGHDIKLEIERRQFGDPSMPKWDPRWRQESPRDQLVEIRQGIEGYLCNIRDGTLDGDSNKVKDAAAHAYELMRQIMTLGREYLPDSWEV